VVLLWLRVVAPWWPGSVPSLLDGTLAGEWEMHALGTPADGEGMGRASRERGHRDGAAAVINECFNVDARLEQPEPERADRAVEARMGPSCFCLLSLVMTKHDEHPRFLTTIPEGCITVSPTEAARVLGVSRATIHSLISRGELPSLKIGGARKILVSHLEEWIRKQIEAEGARRAQKGT